MFGGGGGLNPRKMQKMMEQMGIEMDELDADRVVIELAGGERLVFDDADVTMMEARGQETYQVVGEPTRHEAGEIEASELHEQYEEVAGEVYRGQDWTPIGKRSRRNKLAKLQEYDLIGAHGPDFERQYGVLEAEVEPAFSLSTRRDYGSTRLV